MTLTNVSVIGLGCIGGSIVMSLPGDHARVRGWSASSEDRAMARAAGHDVPEAAESALVEADVIVIAVPVQAMVDVMRIVLRESAAHATILHCGGVQSRQALALDEATFARVRGTHPLAGSQDSGFAAARADLFEGCTVSVERRVTPTQETHARWLWGELRAARLEYRTAEEHDVLMAWISQLPQLASTALAATFAAEHIDPHSVGPGARSTTRLAASAFEQWVALLQAQPAALDAALARLETTVASIRNAVAQGDQRALRQLWDSAREWRRAAEHSA
ncbi:MAG TPA: prephenate dehydrogenase [Gemmatimonadaceae bacterium]|jgi:prephenate dehydrogenase